MEYHSKVFTNIIINNMKASGFLWNYIYCKKSSIYKNELFMEECILLSKFLV